MEKVEKSESDSLLASADKALAISQPQGNISNEPDKAQESFWRRTTAKQKFLVMFIGTGHFTTFLCSSVASSFLERLNKNKDIGVEVQLSVIQQITMLVMAISSAIFGKYQRFVGTRRLLIIGLICFAVCQISIGLAEYGNSMKIFIGAGTVIKALQGVGQGAYIVAALTIVCQEYGESAPQIFSIVESFASIGYIVGPLLGGLLYSVFKGVMLPFVVSGVTIVPLIPIACYLVQNYDVPERDSNSPSITSFISQPIPITIIGVVTTIYGGFGIINVLGTVYLESLGVNVVETGLMYLVMAICYGVLSIVAGYISSIGTKTRRFIFMVGLIGLFGDSFLFTPTQSEDIIYVCLAFYGGLSGFVLIPCFGELLLPLVGENQKFNFEAHSVISGAWNFALGIGAFTFPLIAAPLHKIMQFGYSIVVCLSIGLVLSLFIGLMVHLCRRNKSS